MSDFGVTEANRLERHASVRDVVYVDESDELDVYFDARVRRDSFPEALQGRPVLYANFDRNAVTFDVSGGEA